MWKVANLFFGTVAKYLVQYSKKSTKEEFVRLKMATIDINSKRQWNEFKEWE